MRQKIKEMRVLAQGNNAPEIHTQSVWGRINRFFSIYLTFLFYKTKLTPNQITMIGMLFYAAGLIFYGAGFYAAQITGFVFVALESIIDACDGEIYRLKNFKTKAGGIFTEPFSHDVKYALLFLPVAYGNKGWYLTAAIATVAKLLQRLLEQRWRWIEEEIKLKNAQSNSDAQSALVPNDKNIQKSPIKAVLYLLYRNIFTSTGVLLPLLIATIFRKLDWFIIFYAIAFTAFFIFSSFKKIFALSKLIDENKI